MESTELKGEAASQSPSHAFDVFVSYSRLDRDFAISLEKALESYRFPRSLKALKQTLNVFRDESDIQAAEDYHRAIEQYLEGSAKLVVVCSPDARKSKYVEDEIRRFIETHNDHDIIPVLVRGKANNETSDEAEKAFPEVMCESRMPLAANFLGWETHHGKLDKGPFRSPFYSVLAAINGIDRRRLEQIDEKVRARRRALGLSVASGIILILSVALVFAVISQRKAVAATTKATESAEAERKAKIDALAAAEREKTAKNEAINSAAAEKKARDEADEAKNKAIAAATAEKKAKDEAVAAARAEEVAKNQAIAQKNAAEQLLYTADLNLAPQAYATGNAERSIELLDDLLPPKREDIRGFPWYYLNGLYHRELKGFEALARDALSSSFAPDGTLMATDTGGTIKLWDAATRKFLTEFKSEDANSSAPAGSATAENYSSTLAFSPSKRVLAIAMANGTIKLWDIVNQKLTTLDSSADGPPAMAFAPDGRLATGVNQTYKLWDVAAGKLIATFELDKKSTDPIGSVVAFSHDGKSLAYLQGTVVKVRDMATQEILKSIDVGYLQVLVLAFSADDKLVRVGSAEGVDSFSLKDKTSDSFRVPTGSGVWINSQPSLVVALSPDGLTCATVEAIKVEFGGGVKLWDISSHELLVSFGGLTSNDEVTSLSFSPDSKTLVVGGTKSSQFYDARVQRNSVVIPAVSSKMSAAFFSDSQRFAIAEQAKASNKVTLWDIAALESPATKPLPIDKQSVVAISPNGKTMAITNESSVELWDVAAQRVITTANTDRVAPTVPARPPQRSGQSAAKRVTRLTGLAFSPRGDVLAIGVNGGIQWWQITPSGLFPKPEYDDVEGETVFGLAFSANGKFLTALSVESAEGVVSVRFWDAASRRSLGSLGFAGGAQPTVVAVSADSQTIALGFDNFDRENNAVIAGRPGFSRYMETQLWDVSLLAEPVSKQVPFWEASDENFRKRFLKGTLEGGSVTMNAVAWSSDNKTLATGGTDGTVRLWNRNSYQRLLEMPGQVGAIHRLAFSPDDETLLAAGAEGIQLWYAPRTTGKDAPFVRKANTARTVSPVLGLLTAQSLRGFDLFRPSRAIAK